MIFVLEISKNYQNSLKFDGFGGPAMKKIQKKLEKMDLAASALSKLTDDELSSLQFVMPWQQDVISEEAESGKDTDGFPIVSDVATKDRATLQKACDKV
jgi:hypothetical protein